jgi:hypothetical protein
MRTHRRYFRGWNCVNPAADVTSTHRLRLEPTVPAFLHLLAVCTRARSVFGWFWVRASLGLELETVVEGPRKTTKSLGQENRRPDLTTSAGWNRCGRWICGQSEDELFTGPSWQHLAIVFTVADNSELATLAG